jgi:hypothetical protein
MIKYLKRTQIDNRKWDDCITNSSNGLVYAFSWYLDIICPGWEALVEDDYQKVFPLAHRGKFLINYLYQPYFTQQLGIFSRDKMTDEDITLFIQSIPFKYRFAEINLNTHNTIDLKKYTAIQLLNLELDLNKSYEFLYKGYSQNTRRNIKKASEAGITISKDGNAESIISLFRNNKGKDLIHIKEKDYHLLKRISRECIKRGIAESWCAYYEPGDLCAGVIFVTSMKRSVFLFSATNDKAKETGAMSYLIDRFICEHSDSALTLDFEGSNDPDLARFYKSFGSHETHYFQLHINKLPSIITSLIKVFKEVRKYLINY